MCYRPGRVQSALKLSTEHQAQVKQLLAKTCFSAGAVVETSWRVYVREPFRGFCSM